jgi:hypothetical protein
MLVTKGEYEIDDDSARLDLDVVHGFVTGSYWAEGVMSCCFSGAL